MAKKVEVVKENNWCCWGGSQKGFPSFNPRNTQCMPVVKIFACLELEQN